jgi:hypothetical protein
MSTGKRKDSHFKAEKVLAIAALVVVLMAACFISISLPGTALSDTDILIATQILTGPANTTAPTVPENLSSATLVEKRPDAADLVPYTDRGFNDSVEASIAWWIEPGFGDNTTEYRNYLRATPEEQKTKYSEAKQIFFNFITPNLDYAINASPLHETQVLYRGVSPAVAAIILNNASYIEKAYPSFTYDIAFGLDFVRPSPDGFKNILVIQREKGQDALFINEDEREYLLPRNTSWDVVKAYNVDNLTVKADFTIYNTTGNTAEYNNVRLIYIKERTS